MQHLIHTFDTNVELSRQLAERIAANLAAAIGQRGQATLAVSGGSTPQPLFEALSRQPINWSAVLITTVDERWVEETHADSNARLIKQFLLRDNAKAAQFVGMKTPAESPFEALEEVANQLSSYAPGIDVVVLGMGEDGHTASFFPGASTLAQAMDPSNTQLCVAVHPPAAAHDRMTLSLAALARARHKYLHIVGAAKLAVLQRAYDEPNNVAAMPVRAFLNSDSCDLDIYYAQKN
jgi:6-phosphogluconolactonase